MRRAAPRAGVAAYVPTKCPPETQTEFQEAYAALRALGANRVLETRIPVATAIAQALAPGQSLYSPRFRDSKAPSAYLAALGGGRDGVGLILLETLQKEGVDPTNFERVYAPIGIEIGSETPEEIAVSIAAELVAVRKKLNMRGLKESLRQLRPSAAAQ